MINPVPASRPRFFRRGKFTGTYHAPKYKKFLYEEGPLALKAAMDKLKDTSLFPIESPLEVKAVFKVKKPKTTKLPHPRGDADNYMKALGDLIQPTVVTDDKHIHTFCATKEWTEGQPCIEMKLRLLAL